MYPNGNKIHARGAVELQVRVFIAGLYGLHRTSAVIVAIRDGEISPDRTLRFSSGFFKSPRFATRLRTRILYLFPVSLNSAKIYSSIKAARLLILFLSTVG